MESWAPSETLCGKFFGKAFCFSVFLTIMPGGPGDLQELLSSPAASLSHVYHGQFATRCVFQDLGEVCTLYSTRSFKPSIRHHLFLVREHPFTFLRG